MVVGIFFWKKNKLIDIFSIKLADEFYSNLPPEQLLDLIPASSTAAKQKKTEKKAQKKMESVVDSAVTQVSGFIEAESLGIYGKARLHMQFTERLKELGYEKDLAARVNESIMIKLPGK